MGIKDSLASLLKEQSLIARPIQRWRRSRREQATARALTAYMAAHPVRKLHLGCGTIQLPGWFNTDFFLQSPGALFLDATSRFPIADSSFDYVFHEQMLEHVTYLQGLEMLRECRRILKPGGKVRIATPKLDVVLGLFAPKRTPAQERYIRLVIDSLPPGERVYDPCFVLNNLMHNYGHLFVYDAASLRRSLLEAGFKEPVGCEVGESPEAALRGLESHDQVIGDEWNRFETMVVEAEKPA